MHCTRHGVNTLMTVRDHSDDLLLAGKVEPSPPEARQATAAVLVHALH